MICPKTFKPCCDDLCRMTCIRTGGDVIQRCDFCGQMYCEDIKCSCTEEDMQDRWDSLEDEL